MKREVTLVGGPHNAETCTVDSGTWQLDFYDPHPRQTSVYLPNPDNPDQFVHQSTTER